MVTEAILEQAAPKQTPDATQWEGLESKANALESGTPKGSGQAPAGLASERFYTVQGLKCGVVAPNHSSALHGFRNHSSKPPFGSLESSLCWYLDPEGY